MANLQGKAKFNQKMGRQKFSKGGYIKKLGNKQYFDSGGIATNAIAPPITGGNLTNTNTQGIGGISQALGLNAASANITPGTNVNQLNNAYTGANNAINAQVGLANTLTPQASNAAANQNAVAQQELNMTQGAGPNPAQNQLAQATGTNVANQAALMAGQRGASGNVGLAARNIGQQGASTQQQAAGQAATLQAQQQIAAQQNLANLANQQIGQTQGATTALNTAQQNEQNILQNANTAANNNAVGMQSNINDVNAQANKGILGGITSGLSSLAGGLKLAKGGEVHPVHGKHKLDFVHKMAQMGLKHYDAGTPDGPISDSDPSGIESFQEGFRKATHYADGGQISGNPLIGAIANSPQAIATVPQYNQVQAVGGPNIEQTPSDSGPSLADQMKSGFKAGQDWKTNKLNKQESTNTSGQEANANQPTPENPVLSQQTMPQSNGLTPNPAGPASNDPNVNMAVQGSIDPNETNQTIAQGDSGYHAKGGEIWNLHPSQHAQYAATHFANYFSAGGESKEVEAMVSPGERYWEPEEVEQIKHGADPSKLGRIFPGKDKVPGKDSLKNDIVPTKLREGGIVNPLHVEKTKNPDKMRLFVLKSLKATGKHMKKPMGMK
jgi:hypothetical protein